MRSAIASTVKTHVSTPSIVDRDKHKKEDASAHHLQEKLGVSADDSLEQGIPVGGLLGDGLAECKGVAAGVGLGQVKMVSSNGC